MRTSICFSFIFLLSCSGTPRSSKTQDQKDSSKSENVENKKVVNNQDSLHKCNSTVYIEEHPDMRENKVDTFYMVEVARGNDYGDVKSKAEKVAKFLHSRVDDLGRIYDRKKGIIYPEDRDSGTYAGLYYPRRPFNDQNFVSIEMLWQYEDHAFGSQEMVVYANIFDNKKSADSLLAVVKPIMPKSKVLKHGLYLGCLH